MSDEDLKGDKKGEQKEKEESDAVRGAPVSLAPDLIPAKEEKILLHMLNFLE